MLLYFLSFICSGGYFKNYLKQSNLICVEATSSKTTFRSLDEAKSNCSKLENCTGIQISEFYGNKKIKLCKITKKRNGVGNSCVYKKGNKLNQKFSY